MIARISRNLLDYAISRVRIGQVTVGSYTPSPIAQYTTRIVRMITQNRLVHPHVVQENLHRGRKDVLISLRRISTV